MTFPIITGPGEQFFGVHEISPTGTEMGIRARTRQWAEGTQGDAPVGVLGVPVDNATGYAVIAGAPPGHWSVTTELSLDVFGPVPTDGSDVIATAALVYRNGSTGFAEGRVADGQGNALAHVRQRGLFVAGLPDGGAPPAASPSVHDLSGLGEFFGLDPVGTRRPGVAKFEVTADLVNPMGNLHGGVALCLAEWMAGESLRPAQGSGLRTTSVHMAYLRPAPRGGTLHVATEVLHGGRSFGLIEVTACLSNGKPVFMGRVAGGRG